MWYLRGSGRLIVSDCCKSEEWVPVEGYVGLYEVSSCGRVRSLTSEVMAMGRWGSVIKRKRYGRTLKPDVVKGYGRVHLSRCGTRRCKQIHHLVLEGFSGEARGGRICRHLDGDPSNNHATNLKWGTHKENAADRTKHGREASGRRHHRAKLSVKDVRTIRRLSALGASRADLARGFGVSASNIWAVVVRKTWKNIP